MTDRRRRPGDDRCSSDLHSIDRAGGDLMETEDEHDHLFVTSEQPRISRQPPSRLLQVATALLAVLVVIFGGLLLVLVLQQPPSVGVVTGLFPLVRADVLSSSASAVSSSMSLSTADLSPSTTLFPPLCAPRVGPRVLIASSDNRKHDWPVFPAHAKDYRDQEVLAYTTWAMLSHRLYAMTHGYDLFKADGRTQPLLPPSAGKQYREVPPRKDSWAKMFAARRLLPLYDLLVLIDNDAYFAQPETSVLAFLDQHAPGFLANDNLLMIVSRDNPLTSREDLVNAGVCVVKNSAKARTMIDRLWAAVWKPFDLNMPTPQQPDFLTRHCEQVKARRRTDFTEASGHSH